MADLTTDISDSIAITEVVLPYADFLRLEETITISHDYDRGYVYEIAIPAETVTASDGAQRWWDEASTTATWTPTTTSTGSWVSPSSPTDIWT